MGIFGVKYVFFSENHVKLEMKNNSVYWCANLYNLSFTGDANWNMDVY
jgi:hypothetical protein